jgi:hypothetical protein
VTGYFLSPLDYRQGSQGHQHLDQIKLIVNDLINIFISADRFIEIPDRTEGMNNPLVIQPLFFPAPD